MAGAADAGVCGVCFNHCKYESKGSGFSMVAWEEFKNAGVVPCNERAHFNNVTGEKVTFVSNQRAYTVKCYKGRIKSAMYGRGWRKFYEDNNLGKGQMVVFHLDEPSPTASILWFQVGNGSEDEQPMEEGDPIEDSDSGNEDGEASSDDGEGIVRTRGLLLNETEDAQLQGLLPLSDGFIGFAFVHRVTRTDIRLGMMKIPKKVAAATPFEEQGVVGISVDGRRFKKISYKTTDDGRIVFGSKKWKNFAASRGLKVNTAVLIGFKSSERDDVHVLVILKKLG
ncbi:uncharacterized protein LOC125513218 isoform X1 [Triticum urartu]|uniref:TF-B3 domain-containing protein n=2 Tax=Triticum urartu TaxID=4572 RepID=A0A8R7USZ2_TRIUA|nr:uncharacterized protein LOC125513218 isoform X1 [Triticum urartu]XP_048534214.1 uncharacterized protein LOC125513218 isoform X1 [Triticum urartu]XP_048534215.1 uncharacterized protein LOC125513218 isoform X1 [Triticum urartu]XP_048534216.1 uncharacterized protein LOC125513218 isoform X1 [Triticum urartu]XP_048534217.1 uncharacterized protein LOC125513218 isoform X1 [Triticum urartu]